MCTRVSGVNTNAFESMEGDMHEERGVEKGV
jgi:hypothetical protein